MRRTALRTAAAAAAVVSVFASSAPAQISPAGVIDGPSPDILELGGAAMAGDGSGGLVYRKRADDGRSHIFAARFAGGVWYSPQRVDVDQKFDSTFPRIAAGEGGRLLVIWVQELGDKTDRLYSSSVDPGSSHFEHPSSVDFNIGEATSTWPSVAMNDAGTAYVAYRVVTGTSGVPTGYVKTDLRVARFNGMTWSVLGNLNRNATNPVRDPTAANSPKIGVTVDGDALLAFQEPDDSFVDRVWARRIFGTTPGIPLLVSATNYNGSPVNGPSDQLSLATAGFGAAAVSYRQQPGPGDPLGGSRILVNTIHERFVDDSLQFLGARVVDAAPGGAVGESSVGVAADGSFVTGFGVGDSERLVAGDDGAVLAPEEMGAGLPAGVGDPLMTLGQKNRAAASAWRVRDGDAYGVGIQERPGEGARGARRAVVSAPSSGELQELALGGSGLGDGLVGFRQGGTSGGAIAASVVDAPPSDFPVLTPIPWVRPKKASIRWDAAPDAIGGIRYSTVLDGHVQARGLTRRDAKLDPRGLTDGRHRVQVLATDIAGQQTLSGEEEVKIDGTPPLVRIKARRHRKVSVRIIDGKRRRLSGFSRKKSMVRFGDGKRTRSANVVHRYKRGGRYKIVVVATDKAGNRTRFVRRLRVRG